MNKETIRTVCAVIGVIVAFYAVTIQTAALHFIIKYHPR